jgi:lysozyme
MLIPKHLSTKGALLIAGFEGYRANWYRDAVGVRTIGFGHTGSLPAGFHAPLSRQAALKLLIHDAEACAAAVRAIRPRILKQTRFDALVSLAFNLGPGILGPEHDIGRAVRRRDRAGVPAAIMEYDRAGGRVLEGLRIRRRAEAHLWTTGKYS